MPNCSKAPRGLSVLLQVAGIFTGSVISPSPSLRQLSSRYAIRAGRYLCDKEFRYHRTVIVTAAVHSGLSSSLVIPHFVSDSPLGLFIRVLFRDIVRDKSALPVTYEHWAGISPYTSPNGFAET